MRSYAARQCSERSKNSVDANVLGNGSAKTRTPPLNEPELKLLTTRHPTDWANERAIANDVLMTTVTQLAMDERDGCGARAYTAIGCVAQGRVPDGASTCFTQTHIATSPFRPMRQLRIAHSRLMSDLEFKCLRKRPRSDLASGPPSQHPDSS